jgi:hypothetical protein
MVYISLFLLNINGYPKYLITPYAVLFIMGAILYSEIGNSEIRACGVRSLFLAKAIVSIVLVSIVLNFHFYASISSFDTRSDIKKFLQEIPNWNVKLTTTEVVAGELSRGSSPMSFQDLKKTLNFDERIEECNELILISSTSLISEVVNTKLRNCSTVMQNSSIYIFASFKDIYKPMRNHTLAVSTLGTPYDLNRRGFGPIYWLFVGNQPALLEKLNELCESMSSCEFVKLVAEK